MHETSIALAILRAVQEAYESAGARGRIARVRISVGLLSMVDPEALRFALEVASRGTPAEGARIEIETGEPVLECLDCGHRWSITLDSVRDYLRDEGLAVTLHYYPDAIARLLSCPRCGSSNIRIVRGTGVILEEIEVEDHP